MDLVLGNYSQSWFSWLVFNRFGVLPNCTMVFPFLRLVLSTANNVEEGEKYGV